MECPPIPQPKADWCAQAEGEPPVASTTNRIAVTGVELYYEIHGEGSPLVMLHGGVNPSDFFGAPVAAIREELS